jgi:hypothetical protein
MEEKTKRKGFIECFSDFISEPDNLTQEELLAELKEEGIDFVKLEERVSEIVRKGSTERRLTWQRKARERREEIEKILESKQPANVAQDLMTKIKEILKGSYGQGALSYAEAYFRKKESLSENDLESLIEDLENLNLLEELRKKED